MNTPDMLLTRASECRTSNPEAGLQRLVGAYNGKLLLAEHRMERGWSGTAHSHPHDQMAYVISGHVRITAGSKTFDALTGDSFVIRGGVEHRAVALEDSVVIDVFTPCREDYI